MASNSLPHPQASLPLFSVPFLAKALDSSKVTPPCSVGKPTHPASRHLRAGAAAGRELLWFFWILFLFGAQSIQPGHYSGREGKGRELGEASSWDASLLLATARNLPLDPGPGPAAWASPGQRSASGAESQAAWQTPDPAATVGSASQFFGHPEQLSTLLQLSQMVRRKGGRGFHFNPAHNSPLSRSF